MNDNRYKVVFRDSTVVFDTVVYAQHIVDAAKQARKMTKDPNSTYFNWSVYSITLH